MRYLTLAADYTQSALRDDYIGTVVPEEVGLPGDLGDRIRDWNARYRAVIPLDESQRAQRLVAELIEALDDEGISLVNDIAEALSEVKVRYFSEGHLRYAP